VRDAAEGVPVDVRAMQAYAEELMSQFQRMREGASDLQRRLSEVTATATSPDRFITATVGPRGQLLRLDIDPRVYRNPNSRVLADTITETVQQAARNAADKVAELCKPLMPEAEVRAHLNQDIDAMLHRTDRDLFREDEPR
jgi:DNA-binding protein YbaB